MSIEGSHNEKSDTEREGKFENPTSGSQDDKREWAIRRYHGVGADGRFLEQLTQQEIADRLGVSRQTVNRWVNDPIPLVESWTEYERRTIWTIALQDDVDVLHDFLLLCEPVLNSFLCLLSPARVPLTCQQTGRPAREPRLFEDLRENFEPW
jgi:hypothetical protein